MPLPLKPGESIYIDYKELPDSYSMPTMEAAFDHYTIGYNISGDRKYFTHEKVYYAHGKTIGFIFKYCGISPKNYGALK